MPAHIRSAAVYGIDALPVDVEVDVLQGLPSFTLVGLTDRAIQESRERITAALTNSGYAPPRRKTIVSLAPASLKKEGSLYDLPIVLGFLLASKQVEIAPAALASAWFIGEIGLDGSVRAVRGVLPILLAARSRGITAIYVPAANNGEAVAVAENLTVYAVSSLQELIDHLAHPKNSSLRPVATGALPLTTVPPDIDFAEIRGQDHAKRALMIAAAAHH